MSRKTSERRPAQLVKREEAELRRELELFTATVAGCRLSLGSGCPCHEADQRALEQVRWLLGEES